jgi:hypothetical protein
MEYHIMVFQTLCKHFALPVIWPGGFFNGFGLGSLWMSDPSPSPQPSPEGEGADWGLFKIEFDSVSQVNV